MSPSRTTKEYFTLMAEIMEEPLGDCLLHRAHHHLRSSCWGVIVDWFLERSQMLPNEPERDSAHAYVTCYERALLDDLIALHIRSLAGNIVAKAYNG
jgi:hypothetical protein